MSRQISGAELPLLLLSVFRGLIDELHSELAQRGHPDVRPMHGFVFKAIGSEGTTAADLGRALGVSKQAAGKTVDALETLGYVRRERDRGDARRMLIQLTESGLDCQAKSAEIFADLRQRWSTVLGAERLNALEVDLRKVAPKGAQRLDLPGWIVAGRVD